MHSPQTSGDQVQVPVHARVPVRVPVSQDPQAWLMVSVLPGAHSPSPVQVPGTQSPHVHALVQVRVSVRVPQFPQGTVCISL